RERRGADERDARGSAPGEITAEDAERESCRKPHGRKSQRDADECAGCRADRNPESPIPRQRIHRLGPPGRDRAAPRLAAADSKMISYIYHLPSMGADGLPVAMP